LSYAGISLSSSDVKFDIDLGAAMYGVDAYLIPFASAEGGSLGLKVGVGELSLIGSGYSVTKDDDTKEMEYAFSGSAPYYRVEFTAVTPEVDPHTHLEFAFTLGYQHCIIKSFTQNMTVPSNSGQPVTVYDTQGNDLQLNFSSFRFGIAVMFGF
jgi:hypothetical protein